MMDQSADAVASQESPHHRARSSGGAIVSLMIGILSLAYPFVAMVIVMMTYSPRTPSISPLTIMSFEPVVALVGLFLGVHALEKTRRAGGKMTGGNVAMTGIVCCTLSLLVCFLSAVGGIIMFRFM